MKRHSKKALIAMALITTTVTASIVLAGWGGGGGNSRRNSRMETEKPKGSSNTVNYKSGTKTNESGHSEAAQEADKVSYDSDVKMHCRAGALKLNRVFNGVDQSQGTSEFPVGDLNDAESFTGSCLSAKPTMLSATGYAVASGTITVRCSDGSLNITAATCASVQPTPTPPPPPPPTPTPAPDPYSHYVNRGSCGPCAPSATSSCKKRGGKEMGTRTVSYFHCKSGKYYYSYSGACVNANGCN